MDPKTAPKHELPRAPADAISRRRLVAWFDAQREKRLRLIAGSPGTGKTVLLANLLKAAQAKREHFVYAKLRPSEGALALRARLAEALDLDASSSKDRARFFRFLGSLPRTTLAIDNADVLSDEALDELNAIVTDAPDTVSFVIATRSRRVIHDARLFVEGSATRMPADMLDFSVGELAELCDAANLSYTSSDLSKLIFQTEGWAIVIAGCVRETALAQQSASEAFATWMRHHRGAFIEYVRQEAERSGNAQTLERAVSSLTVGNLADLEKLEQEGMFVRFEKGQYSLLRLVRHLFSFDFSQTSAPARQFVLMKVNVLGEFETWIGDRKIEWIRRRDAQIFKYALLKPDGRATRAELLEVFWPGRERQLALQALRTSCSNIRQVLREAVGPPNVANYFQAEGDIVVPPGCSLIDLHRFTSFVATAESLLASGDITSAIANFEAALALYRGNLILDVENAHYESLAKNAEAMFEKVSTHLRALRNYPKKGADGTAGSSAKDGTRTNVRPLKRKHVAEG